jgi:hypothetical protein
MTTFRLNDTTMSAPEPQLVIAVSPDMRPGFFLAGSESWRILDQRAGLAQLKEVLDTTSQGIADLLGIRKRTVEGWIQGRPLRGATLAQLNRILKDHYGAAYVGARPDIILR